MNFLVKKVGAVIHTLAYPSMAWMDASCLSRHSAPVDEDTGTYSQVCCDARLFFSRLVVGGWLLASCIFWYILV